MKEFSLGVPHDISLLWPVITIVPLLLFAIVVWFVFLRPVPRQLATGVIVSKTYKPAGTHYQFPTGDRTNFFTPTRIPIAECYIFTIQAEGQPRQAVFSLNTTAAERFDVGQKVDVVYEVRGLPWIWKVACILEMKPIPNRPIGSSACIG